MSAKDILKQAKVDTSWMQEAEYRQANEDWLDISFSIAIKVLRAIRAQNISQKELAERMHCSPQHINKIVKGSENLTLETICKLERALQIKLIEMPRFEQTCSVDYDIPSSMPITITLTPDPGLYKNVFEQYNTQEVYGN